jgi:NADH-quinone oxidoreductase subunit M
LDDLGGLAKSMPLLSGFWLVGAMALLGLPGMSGFISEFFAFVGLYHVRPVVAVIGALGIILAATYSLRAIMKMTFGPLQERFSTSTDVKWSESLPMWILTGLIVLIGVYPDILDVSLNQALSFLVSRIGG